MQISILYKTNIFSNGRPILGYILNTEHGNGCKMSIN